MTEAKRRILIVGDVVVEHNLFQDRRATPDSKNRGIEHRVEMGGARRLYELVKAGANAPAPVPYPLGATLSVDFGLELADKPDGELTAFAVWQPVAKTWQVQHAQGYGTQKVGRKLKASRGVSAAYDVTVIDDANLDLHANEDCWPQLASGHVIVKLSTPAAPGALWQYVMSKAAARTTAVIDAADLRTMDVRLTQGISWERTALDLVGELDDNPALHELCRARNLIVRFALEGALHVVLEAGEAIDARLVYESALREGDRLAERKVKPIGLSTAFAAALSLHADAEGTPGSLMAGIQCGLAVAVKLSELGYGPSEEVPAFPEKELVEVLLGSEPALPVATITLGLDAQKAEGWSILSGTRAVGVKANEPLYGLAQRLAEHGLGALWDVPSAKVGAFVTVDRSEIESVRALAQLIEVYKERDEGKKPLSIGVFGPPGAGKSFAVKELAKAKLGGKYLEFNLSQFSDPLDLIGALHQVRDMVLAGALPLVFWDEFDSEEYRWLKYLLAPMQDGKFQEGQLSHPIGKCVFVFAGGTAPTFDRFGKPEESWPGDVKKKADQHFKLAKGPDFKSRLAGNLDVLGPNPRKDYSQGVDNAPIDPSDVAFPLRRALLLRGQLRAGGEPLTFDKALLSALLEVKEYRHGSRSMEKVAYYLQNRGSKDAFRRSDLPAPTLLEQHIDVTDLFQKTRRAVSMSCVIDQLAEDVHEWYRQKYPDGKYNMPFKDVPRQIRADNYAAAARIGHVLGSVGLKIVTRSSSGALSSAELTEIIQTDLPKLAEAEHDGWQTFKAKCGWRAGLRNKSLELLQLQHKLLVPYKDLPPDEQAKDQDAVRYYVAILESGGWAAARASGTPP